MIVKGGSVRRNEMSKDEWKIIHECDLENGTPTEWALKVADNVFYWIDAKADSTFDVIDSDNETVLKNCKSLSSAKRWVANYIKRGSENPHIRCR